MKTSKLIRYCGLGLLLAAWIWLAWGFLAAKGITLLNLIILVMTAIIIFVPLYKKYFTAQSSEKEKRNKE